MNIDVLMHAALRRVGSINVEWLRAERSFRATVSGSEGPWSVAAPSWNELWERFILEAVARR